MGKNIPHLLREDSEGEGATAPTRIRGDDITLDHRRAMTFEPSGAQAHQFDINDKGGKRVGQIHVILEPDPEQLAGNGHICGFMLQGHEDAGRLARAASALESFAASNGVPVVRYVIPSDCQASLDALGVLGHARKGECVDEDGLEYVVFET